MLNRKLVTIWLLTAQAANAFNVQRVSIQSTRSVGNTITKLHEGPSGEQEQESKSSTSAAAEWDKELKKSYDEDTERKRKFLVVGGGWGGW